MDCGQKNYLAVIVYICAGMYVDVSLRAHILLVQSLGEQSEPHTRVFNQDFA